MTDGVAAGEQVIIERAGKDVALAFGVDGELLQPATSGIRVTVHARCLQMLTVSNRMRQLDALELRETVQRASVVWRILAALTAAALRVLGTLYAVFRGRSTPRTEPTHV